MSQSGGFLIIYRATILFHWFFIQTAPVGRWRPFFRLGRLGSRLSCIVCGSDSQIGLSAELCRPWSFAFWLIVYRFTYLLSDPSGCRDTRCLASSGHIPKYQDSGVVRIRERWVDRSPGCVLLARTLSCRCLWFCLSFGHDGTMTWPPVGTNHDREHPLLVELGRWLTWQLMR